MAIDNIVRFVNPISDIEVTLQKLFNQRNSVLEKNKNNPNASSLLNKPIESLSEQDKILIKSNPSVSDDFNRLIAIESAQNALMNQKDNLESQYLELYGSALQSNKNLIDKIQSTTSERLKGLGISEATQRGAIQGLIGKGASAGQRIKALGQVSDKAMADRAKIMSEGLEAEIKADPTQLISSIAEAQRSQMNFDTQVAAAQGRSTTKGGSRSPSGTVAYELPDQYDSNGKVIRYKKYNSRGEVIGFRNA